VGRESRAEFVCQPLSLDAACECQKSQATAVAAGDAWRQTTIVMRKARVGGQNFPSRWDEERVRAVLPGYESQSEDKGFAEIEVAHEAESVTLVVVAKRLMPEVHLLRAHAAGA